MFSCSVSEFVAPSTSFLWHDSFAQFIPSSTSYVGRAVNATVCSTGAETQGRGGGFAWEEHRGTSRLPAPVYLLPCSLRWVLPTQWTTWVDPFLSASLPLSCLAVYPNTAPSSPTLPIVLYLAVPRKLWDSQHIYIYIHTHIPYNRKLFLLESLTKWLANVSGLLFREQMNLF